MVGEGLDHFSVSSAENRGQQDSLLAHPGQCHPEELTKMDVSNRNLYVQSSKGSMDGS